MESNVKQRVLELFKQFSCNPTKLSKSEFASKYGAKQTTLNGQLGVFILYVLYQFVSCVSCTGSSSSYTHDESDTAYWNNVKKNGENYVIRDVRKKTDEEYYLLLLKPALRILKKYKFKLPIITNQKYNDYLKMVGVYSGIDKVLYSHMARHSFAVMMASNGVTFSILAKMMGHANSKITELVYAKILASDVKDEYDRINKILK